MCPGRADAEVLQSAPAADDERLRHAEARGPSTARMSWQRPRRRPDSVSTTRPTMDENVLNDRIPESSRCTVGADRPRVRARARRARLRSLTCEPTPATSSHGMRTRPPPPSQAAIRPITSRPRTPDSGAAEDRDHFEVPARRALERDVVDLAATPAVGVEQLMVEQVEPEVDRLRQFCPTFVRIMSGMAVTAITMITTRYRIPSAFAIRPFVYSRM